MYQKERVDKILSILRQNGYINVKYLCGELGYSKATINRDLNYMEKQNLIIRSYGGVELVEKKSIPLSFRYHKMKNEKKNLCKAAAELVNDGEIGGGGGYSLLLNVMAKNSKKVIYLADHTKMNLDSTSVIMTADKVDVIISDFDFCENFKEKYGKIEYIKIQ